MPSKKPRTSRVPDFLSLNQAARFLQQHPRRIRWLCSERLIPHYVVEKSFRRFRPGEVAFLRPELLKWADWPSDLIHYEGLKKGRHAFIESRRFGRMRVLPDSWYRLDLKKHPEVERHIHSGLAKVEPYPPAKGGVRIYSVDGFDLCVFRGSEVQWTDEGDPRVAKLQKPSIMKLAERFQEEALLAESYAHQDHEDGFGRHVFSPPARKCSSWNHSAFNYSAPYVAIFFRLAGLYVERELEIQRANLAGLRGEARKDAREDQLLRKDLLSRFFTKYNVWRGPNQQNEEDRDYGYDKPPSRKTIHKYRKLSNLDVLAIDTLILQAHEDKAPLPILL